MTLHATPPLGPVILTDLDDTIFTTMKSYGGQDPQSLRQVAEGGNGNHSYMCGRRQAIWGWLAAGATVIPVTARSRESFARVRLPFAHGAVLSNGAVILGPDGGPDRGWHRRTEAICATAAPLLAEAEGFAAGLGDAYRHAVHRLGDAVVGLTIKSNPHTGDDAAAARHLAPLREQLAARLPGLVLAVNGNALAILPAGISKLAAVRHLLATRPDLAGRPLIGAGDSHADLPFMQLCDIVLVPNGTRNAEILFGLLER